MHGGQYVAKQLNVCNAIVQPFSSGDIHAKLSTKKATFQVAFPVSSQPQQVLVSHAGRHGGRCLPGRSMGRNNSRTYVAWGRKRLLI
jgi:hypothetical protein